MVNYNIDNLINKHGSELGLLLNFLFRDRYNKTSHTAIDIISSQDWQSNRNCPTETYFNRTAQHTGSHVALANIHNILDLHPECVPSQVLNLTWFQMGAEVTQRLVWGTNSSQAIRWSQILQPWMVRAIIKTSPHFSHWPLEHNQSPC